MRQVTIDDAESFGFGDGVDHRTLHGALGVSGVAINRFRLAGDTRLPWGLHAHYDQEELFLVTAGVVTFDTLDGTVSVPAGDAICFERGEYQAGYNAHDDPATFFAIGIPDGTDDIRIPLVCPDCSGHELTIDLGGDELRCPDCDAAVEAACPVCGEDDREVRLDETAGELVDVCRSCGDRTSVRSLE